ncbi:MAG: DsbA family protein [Fulvimarina manganoxydans]|uniref:DsbA family protein n=1 Tax=Fulvimarina manganoxydans TaxID=937218 RepID=UPI002353225B|nr:DsbA family protein [Fulvimarina manganoxydans]MCK5931212.1 DsbA family protein [Fulvimarina manganoxydans]
MRSLLTKTLLASAIALSAATAPTLAEVPFKGEEKAAIETIIRDYLIANPEVLIEAMDALQTKQALAQREARADVIAKAGDALTDAPEGMILGNPNGDVTVVEFFDYNCGYCRQALEDMNALIEADDNVRFVLKEFPILGPQSVEASRVSLAFRDLAPEKYPEFHRSLLARRSMADKAAALEVAKDLGVEADAIEAKMNDTGHIQELQAIQDLAANLQINGTPSYVIGGEVIQARVGIDGLKQAVGNMRECGKADCS